MATAAFGKMTGKQAAITILGVALIGGTTWGATSFIEAQKQIRLSEIASQERQKTISDLTSSMESQADQYAKILDTMRANGEFSSRGADTAEAINSGRLRAASGVDETEIGGIHISGDQARELRASLRRKSSKRTVTQDMRVVDVNTADPASTTIILEDPITGDQVKVTYSDRLVQDSQRGIVHSALQERTPASFTLKVTEIEGDIISTEIVAVKPAENEYED